MFLETLNISAPAPGPEPTSTSVPVDGALVQARDPSYVVCDIWQDDNGNPVAIYMATPDQVRKNMDEIRARSDKPPTVAAVSPIRPLNIMAFRTQVGSYLLTHSKGDLKVAICSGYSGIYWTVNITVGLPMIHNNLRHPPLPQSYRIPPFFKTSC